MRVAAGAAERRATIDRSGQPKLGQHRIGDGERQGADIEIDIELFARRSGRGDRARTDIEAHGFEPHVGTNNLQDSWLGQARRELPLHQLRAVDRQAIALGDGGERAGKIDIGAGGQRRLRIKRGGLPGLAGLGREGADRHARRRYIGRIGRAIDDRHAKQIGHGCIDIGRANHDVVDRQIAHIAAHAGGLLARFGRQIDLRIHATPGVEQDQRRRHRHIGRHNGQPAIEQSAFGAAGDPARNAGAHGGEIEIGEGLLHRVDRHVALERGAVTINFRRTRNGAIEPVDIIAAGEPDGAIAQRPIGQRAIGNAGIEIQIDDFFGAPGRPHHRKLARCFVREQRQIGEVQIELEIGQIGGIVAIGQQLDLVIGQPEIVGGQARSGTRQAPRQVHHPGQQPVGQFVANAQIGAGTIERQVEPAGQRQDIAAGLERERAFQIAPGHAGERRDAGRLDCNIAVEIETIELPAQYRREHAAGNAQLRQLNRLPGIPQPGNSQPDTVAQRCHDLFSRGNAAQRAITIEGDAARGGIGEIARDAANLEAQIARAKISGLEIGDAQI